MSLNPLSAVAAIAVAALPAAAHAADPPVAPALTRLIECRSVTDPAQRLSCYDTRLAELEAAAARKEVVVVDRDQIRKARRTLFGLTLPNLGIFGDSAEEGEGVSRIDTTIAQVQETADGKWLLTLAEGGTWQQTDSRELIVDPSPKDPITIRRAALGSYLANIQGQPAIRVKRIR